MQSILLCEGATDFSLLQMFMIENNGWQEDPKDKTIQNTKIHIDRQKSRVFKRKHDLLTIMATGGCSRICEGLELTIDRIRYSSPPFDTAYKKIAIVTDNDEQDTTQDTIHKIHQTLMEHDVNISENLINRKWISCNIMTDVKIPFEFEILLLVIPFDKQGAMETFLLDAIAQNDIYDSTLIQKCKSFVSNADPDKRYLNKRAYETKAEFAAYFCIRTPAEAYSERNSIMKTGVSWSDYTMIQHDFVQLSYL